MGGGRVHEYVRQVWGVDLVEAALRESLDLPPALTPSRKPRCTVVNGLLYALAAVGWPRSRWTTDRAGTVPPWPSTSRRR